MSSESPPEGRADPVKFQLGLRIDSAKELLLLWRSIIVVEVIVAFLLIRQWVLWFMGYA